MTKNLFAFVTFGLTQFSKLAAQSIRETVANPYDLFAIVGKPGDNETIEWLISERIPHKIHNENMGFSYGLNDIFDYAWKENNYDNLVLLGNDVILYRYAGDSLINFANSTDYEIISAKQYDVRDLIKDYPETSQYFEGEKLIITDFSGKPWEKFTDYSKEVQIADMQLYDIQNLCLYKKSVFDKVGYTDINFYPCLDPNTKILTSKLNWVTIKDIEIGDELVGVDEFPDKIAGSRKYRISVVEGKTIKKADCVRINFSDGRSVICSDNHRWLVKAPISEGFHWKESKNLKIGERMCSPLKPWKFDNTYDCGWMAGMYDGEGCIHKRKDGWSLAFYQKKGKVLDKFNDLLLEMEVPFCTYDRQSSSASCIEIRNKSAVLEVLGRLRPQRLLDKLVIDGMNVRAKNYSSITITNVESIGERDVIDIQTSTKTFIAEGFVTHNCYFVDNDYAMRMNLADIRGCTLTNARFFHFWSRVFKQGTGGSTDRYFDLNKLYYKSKWGGTVGNERRIPKDINIRSRDEEEEIINLWRKR